MPVRSPLVSCSLRRRSYAVGAAALTTAALATGVAIAPQASAATVTLYVATTGSDTAAGTSTAPLKTIQKAVNSLPTAGGVIRVKAGTYAGRVLIAGRTGITLMKDSATATVTVSGTGITPPAGNSGLIEISDSSSILVQGLNVTGYVTGSTGVNPVGIYVQGGGSNVTIDGNRVYGIKNTNSPTDGKNHIDINAHGIAAYGNNRTTSLYNLKISNNEVYNNVLGQSETVVVNGNVDTWRIEGNNVHDNNNIGIDAIGYEEQIFGKDDPLRYTDTNRARNGVITNNTVKNVTTVGNPAYKPKCNCADGIYVDGGFNIEISNNTVTSAEIGIEVASEDGAGKTNDVKVLNNTVSKSAWVGIAAGGYGKIRGQAYNVTISGNVLTDNNQLNDGSPELYIQHYVHDSVISGNTFTTHSTFPLFVQRVPVNVDATHPASLSDKVTFSGNNYKATVGAAKAKFMWPTTVTGFAAWQALGFDTTGTYTQITA